MTGLVGVSTITCRGEKHLPLQKVNVNTYDLHTESLHHYYSALLQHDAVDAARAVCGHGSEDGTCLLNPGCSPFLRAASTILHMYSSVGNTRETFTF